MSRLKFGPSFDGVVVPGETLPDVEVLPVAAAARTVTLSVPDFDPLAAVPPVAVHACYLSTPPDQALTAADVLSGTDAAFVGHATVASSGEVTIEAPGVPAGTYFVQTVIEYAE